MSDTPDTNNTQDTPVTPNPLLVMLKIDLGLTTTAYDERLEQLLTASTAAIIREGAATLDASEPQDAQLVVMYAAWQWRRRDTGEGMPRMLRWALNNRVLGEKMQGGAT